MSTESIMQLRDQVKAMYPQFGSRLDKAVNLVNGDCVRQQTDGTYLVKSLATDYWYGVGFEPVTAHNPGWFCPCYDCKNGAPVLDFCGSVQSRVCKHIIAASLTWIMEDQAEPIPEPAFIQESPQWSIESAGGFKAMVSRDGQVSYIDDEPAEWQPDVTITADEWASIRRDDPHYSRRYKKYAEYKVL